MATDGVKIIDGDTAFDIYSTFMDLYNSGTAIDELKQRYETDRKNFLPDAVEYEICVTAYALAFWETGALTAEMLDEVKTVIARKANVDDWTEQCGEAAGKARQRELDRFLTKIGTPKVRPKKRMPPPKPAIGDDDRQIVDEAENLKMHSEFDRAKALYKKLLDEKPGLHEIRFKYIELLCFIPKNDRDCPELSSEDTAAYLKFIREHADWHEIECQCKYMLAHRDIDRMDVSQRKKNKISEWFVFVASRLNNALIAQEKYEEAIAVIDGYIKFELSCSNTEFDWYVNDFGTMYKCCLLLHDDEKAKAFREKCKAEWTLDKINEKIYLKSNKLAGWDWDRFFTGWKNDVEKYGEIQVVL